MAKSQPQSISAENTTTELIDRLDLRVGNKVEVEALCDWEPSLKKEKFRAALDMLCFWYWSYILKKV